MDALPGRRRLRARRAADGLGFPPQIATAPPRFRRAPGSGPSHAAERWRTIMNTLAVSSATRRPVPALPTFPRHVPAIARTMSAWRYSTISVRHGFTSDGKLYAIPTATEQAHATA